MATAAAQKLAELRDRLVGVEFQDDDTQWRVSSVEEHRRFQEIVVYYYRVGTEPQCEDDYEHSSLEEVDEWIKKTPRRTRSFTVVNSEGKALKLRSAGLVRHGADGRQTHIRLATGNDDEHFWVPIQGPHFQVET